MSFSTGWAIRLAKALLVFSVGAFAFFVVFGNLTDYWTNFNFVAHVLAMDAQKPELAAVSNINYRAIDWSWFHHLAYVGVIAVEAFIMVACLVSAWKMIRGINRDDATFTRAKRWGVLGCLAGLMLWFFGFQAVGGEWFGMWMNDTWNGIPDAVRLCTFIGLVLVFVSLRNDSLESASHDGTDARQVS